MKQCNGRQIQILWSFFPNCCVYEWRLLSRQYEEWQNQQQISKHKLSIQWSKLAKLRIFPPLEIFQTNSFHNKDPWMQAKPKIPVKCKLGTFCMSLPPDCMKWALRGWCNVRACPSAPKNGKERLSHGLILAECWQSGCKNGQSMRQSKGTESEPSFLSGRTPGSNWLSLGFCDITNIICIFCESTNKSCLKVLYY